MKLKMERCVFKSCIFCFILLESQGKGQRKSSCLLSYSLKYPPQPRRGQAKVKILSSTQFLQVGCKYPTICLSPAAPQDTLEQKVGIRSGATVKLQILQCEIRVSPHSVNRCAKCSPFKNKIFVFILLERARVVRT